jgi:transcriptional regulator with XRE-family HTH domain
MKKQRIYGSLQEWMEGTGTTADTLSRRTGIGRSHLSRILSRSRRCSFEKAFRLSEATGVPVENILRWFMGDSEAISERVFKSQAAK